MMSIQKHFLFIAAFLVVISAQTPISDAQEQQPDIITAIETDLDFADSSKSAIEPWIPVKAHLILARYFFAEGNIAKGEEHLYKIKFVRDRRILSRPYFDRILMLADKNDLAGVTAMIQNAAKDKAWMDSVPWADKLHDPETQDVSGEYINETWLQENYCEFAIRSFAAKRNFAALDQVLQMEQCAKKRHNLDQYKIDALVRSGDYTAAYTTLNQKIAKTADNVRFNLEAPALNSFRACLPPNATAKGEREAAFLNNVIADNSTTASPILRAGVLEVFQQNDAALQILKTMSDKQVIQQKAISVALPIYESYYLAQDSEKMMDVVSYMGTLQKDPESSTLAEAKAPPAWWVKSLPEVRILQEKPSPLAFALVQQISNDKARFKALQDIFLNPQSHEIEGFPNCTQTTRQCMMSAMEKIADEQRDEVTRDTMNGLLSEMARLINDAVSQQKFMKKIIQTDRMQCAYDACNRRTIIPLSFVKMDQKETSHKSGIFDSLLAQRYDFVMPEDLDSPLAGNMAMLHQHMLDNNTNYKLVSTQKGKTINFEGEGKYDSRGRKQSVCLVP
jgi:hypothetical protein